MISARFLRIFTALLFYSSFYRHALDGNCFACFVVYFKYTSTHHAGQIRHVEPGGHTRFLPVYGYLRRDAYHRLLGTGHAQVRDVSGALLQYLGVGGLHMGVGAEKRRHSAVKVEAHRPFFGGRLGVKIHKLYRAVTDLFQYPVDAGKWVFVRVEIHLAHEIYHRRPGESHIRYLIAGAGIAFIKIRRTDDIPGCVQQVVDLPAAVDVVAGGNDVHSAVQQVPGGLRGYAVAFGGVFPVGDAQIYFIQFFEGRQVSAHKFAALAPHYVAYGKNYQFKPTCKLFFRFLRFFHCQGNALLRDVHGNDPYSNYLPHLEDF